MKAKYDFSITCIVCTTKNLFAYGMNIDFLEIITAAVYIFVGKIIKIFQYMKR